MSNTVTCPICSGPVDTADTVEMPNGLVCADPCYKMLDELMEEMLERGDG